MIGIELDFEQFRLVRRERGKVLEFAEGPVTQLSGFKGEDVYLCFRAPKTIGKLYEGKVSPGLVGQELGTVFETRKRSFKSRDGSFTFVGGVEKDTYNSVLELVNSIKIPRLRRLDFSPFVLHDLLYFYNFALKHKDFIALSFNGKYFFYAICKGSIVRLVSSAESAGAMELIPELVKTFFEEGLNFFVLTGDYSKEILSGLKEISEDGEIEILNPFIEFKIATSKEVKQAAFSNALGVTL